MVPIMEPPRIAIINKRFIVLDSSLRLVLH